MGDQILGKNALLFREYVTTEVPVSNLPTNLIVYRGFNHSSDIIIESMDPEH
jgi:hypothetical protein